MAVKTESLSMGALRSRSEYPSSFVGGGVIYRGLQKTDEGGSGS